MPWSAQHQLDTTYHETKVQTLCRRTDAGSAYPWDTSVTSSPDIVPGLARGNIGMGFNAVCLAGIYDKLQGSISKDAQCFMDRQLGFSINNKCEESNTAKFKCATGADEGYSYMVGCAPLFAHSNHHASSRHEGRVSEFKESKLQRVGRNLLFA